MKSLRSRFTLAAIIAMALLSIAAAQDLQRDRAHPASKPARELTAEQWREDLRFFAAEFPKTHRNPWHAISREELDAAVKKLDERIPRLKRDQIIVGISQIVAMIGDGHTCFHSFYDPEVGFRRYPVIFYQFSDGLYVRAAAPRLSEAVGGRLVRLGHATPEEAMRAAATVDGHDNDMWPKLTGPWRLETAEVVDALGLTDDMEHTPLVVEKNGKQVTVMLEPEAVPEEDRNSSVLPKGWIDAAGGKLLWQKDIGNKFWYQLVPEHRALYVQFNSVQNKAEGETLAAFFDRAYAFADQHKVERLVLDMRNNGGGNNYLVGPIVRGIMRSPRLSQRGRVYVIIGRHTFSAAQNTVNYLKKWTDVIFVGEPTGSSVNQFGDAVPVKLPNSGLMPYASTVWWQDQDERVKDPWLAPDLSVEMSGQDYDHGRDPVLELALSAKPEVPIDEQVRAAVAKGDLARMKEVVREFRNNPRHKYVNFSNELNLFGYELMAQKNMAASIAVLEAYAASFPEDFNSWDSLAEAFMNNGEKQKAIANYKKSLELNPKNTNAVAMLAKLRQ